MLLQLTLPINRSLVVLLVQLDRLMLMLRSIARLSNLFLRGSGLMMCCRNGMVIDSGVFDPERAYTCVIQSC